MMPVVKIGCAFLLCMVVVNLTSADIPDAEMSLMGGDDDQDESFDFSDDNKNVLLDGKTFNENANTLELRLSRQLTTNNFRAVLANRTCCRSVNDECNECGANTPVVCNQCTGGMSCGTCEGDSSPTCIVYCQCCCSAGVDGKSCNRCECGTSGCSLVTPGYNPTPTPLSRQCEPTQTCQCFRNAGICQAFCDPPSA